MQYLLVGVVGRLFAGMQREDLGIVTREEVLMPEYFPAGLQHRETEMQAIAEAVKPLIEGRQPDNLFIHGDSGTGKTTCVKRVLEEMNKYTSKVKTVYVNCWEYSTRIAVYSLIVNALKEILPRRGLATDEVFDRITDVMEKDGMRVLVVLDEMDGLFFHNEEKLLYELARAGKGKPFFGIIGISNDPYLLVDKDVRIKSSLRLTDFAFKHYDQAQMAAILSERAKAGLMPGSWGKDVIDACAEKAVARKSNVRVGLELLWKAAKHADKADKKKITVEDVEAVDGKTLYDAKTKKPLVECSFEIRSKSLAEEEKLILEILKGGEKQSSELYPAFCKKLMRTKRQIRNYLKALEAKKLIVVEEVKGSSPMLNTKKIRLSWQEVKK
ncbi:ORC1-type DNA replication protein [Candidatus Burarchaeum australiense]|nr:ORC1-type DNA replication protein [Candidatus Burarchaeum australiense]